MTAPQPSHAVKAPWHLWMIGTFGLLWSAVGAFDYLMTETRNAAYLAKFTTQQMEFFYGIPAWAIATWAIAVWGGVVGCLLLLLRKQAAVWVLAASVAGMVITAFQNFALANGMEVMGASGAIFSVFIFLFSLGLYLYARAMKATGVLT